MEGGGVLDRVRGQLWGGKRAAGRVILQNMKRAVPLIACCFSFLAAAVSASVLNGPGRFCGYSPIIDLQFGETITTLDGGIHGGTFEWRGGFGSLIVHGIGWASRPKGRLVADLSDEKPARFAERKQEGKYILEIWNGRQGVAVFQSATPFTQPQLAAIDRVRLFQEGEEPANCSLRTVFDWNIEE